MDNNNNNEKDDFWSTLVVDAKEGAKNLTFLIVGSLIWCKIMFNLVGLIP